MLKDSDFVRRSIIAISLSLFAGLATAFGGCIVYFKKLVKLANKTFLSAALGFSAGVMLFLSFAEIFIESKQHFSETTSNEHLAMLYACLSLFSGIGVAFLLEAVLHRGSNVEFEIPEGDERYINNNVHGSHELRKVQGVKTSNRMKERRNTEGEVVRNPIVVDSSQRHIGDDTPRETLYVDLPKSGYEIETISGNTRDLSKTDFYIDSNVQSQLKAVGVMSAIAITLHNIPEGIVTYIGYIDNPIVGISLAIGIATHNIPEGLSVALPVYYATKSRHQAFLWSLLSGLAEPLGALLCMLVLQRFINNAVFGFLFGFTGGIMTHICVFELIPTGIQLDCEKNYTTIAFIVGMGFIMISLILL